MSKNLYLVPDTNFFMHCKPIDQLDLSEYSHFENITVVVLREVLSEINNFKENGGPRLQRKARRIYTYLEPLADNNGEFSVKAKNKDINILSKYIPKAILGDSMPLETVDDKIVASAIILHRDESPKGNKVIYVSSDINTRITAGGEGGLEVLKPKEEWKAVTELNQDSMELKNVKEELAQLRKSSPYIELVRKKYKVDNIYFEPLTDSEVSELTELAKSQAPFRHKREIEQPYQRVNNSTLQRQYADVWRAPSATEIESYHNKYVQWLDNIEAYLREIYIEIRADRGCPKVTLEFKNTGGKPAIGTLISFTPRANIELTMDKQIFSDDNNIHPPMPPEPPVGKWSSESSLSIFGERASKTPFEAPPFFRSDPDPDPEVFYFGEERSVSKNEKLILTSEKWRHGLEAEQFDLYIVTDYEDEIEEVNISCEIHADNLVSPFKETVSVVLNNKIESCYILAREIILNMNK